MMRTFTSLPLTLLVGLLVACSPEASTPEWTVPSQAEQRAWKNAAGLAPEDPADIVAATLSYPAETQTIAYATLRSDRERAEVTVKALGPELALRYPGGVPDGHRHEERWMTGQASNSLCEPTQQRVLVMTGEVPPRQGQEWTGAAGLLPDPEPCSGLPVDSVTAAYQGTLELNRWNTVYSAELGGERQVSYRVAVYPSDQVLPASTDPAADLLTWLEVAPGQPVSVEGFRAAPLPQ